MVDDRLSMTETMQIHELLNLKTICMTKSKLMEGLVFDQDLKALLEKDAQQSIMAVDELQKLLSKGETLGEEMVIHEQ